jgi:DNA topoisomerase VI subunit A
MVTSNPHKKRKARKTARKAPIRRGDAQPEAPAPEDPPPQTAIGKIKGFLAKIFTGLETLELVDLRITPMWGGVMQEENCMTRSFGRIQSIRSYTRMVVVASLVYELLENDETVTLRGVFYMLFKKRKLAHTQSQTSKCIRELGTILSLKTPQMNIVPEPRGWITGGIRFRFNSRGRLNGGKLSKTKVWGNLQVPLESANQSMQISDEWLVADDDDIEMVVGVKVEYILVIEKLTIFRRLVNNKVIDPSKCILVCTSGEYD